MRIKKWNKEQLQNAVANSTSIRQVIYKLGLKPAGGNYAQVNRYVKEYKFETGHLTGKVWNKGLKGIGKPRIPLEKILIDNSSFQSYKLKNRLFSVKLKSPACELCGWNKKSVDGRIPLELDHINGNRLDNRLLNLRILCPNCHSLQPTHRGLNRKRS